MMSDDGEYVGAKAMGAYIGRLRNLRGWSQFELAQQAQLGGQDYVSKIELGKKPNPELRYVAAIMRVLGGSLDQAMGLLLDGDSELDIEVAKALAQKRMKEAHHVPTPEEQHIQQIIDALRNRPEYLQKWIVYGQALADIL